MAFHNIKCIFNYWLSQDVTLSIRKYQSQRLTHSEIMQSIKDKSFKSWFAQTNMYKYIKEYFLKQLIVIPRPLPINKPWP